jgi:hypothetical protein
MEPIEFLIFKAWLIDGWSQPDIDEQILKIKPSPSHNGYQCWEILNAKYGLTKEYKHMFKGVMEYNQNDFSDVNECLESVRIKLGHDIPEYSEKMIKTFWRGYLDAVNRK